MTDKKLSVVSIGSVGSVGSGKPTRASKDAETRAFFERQWMTNPHQFNPDRSCIERERILRTWQALEPLLESKDHRQAADLGVGWGVLTKRLADRGVTVVGIDVASNALKHFQDNVKATVELKREALPNTSLPDSSYDIVLCTDVIADMHPHDQRLLVSEIFRLLKKNGHFVCSTPLDVDTEGALERFIALLETELKVEHTVISYYALFINLKRFLEAPERYVKARDDLEFKKKQLKKRGVVGRLWFELQSSLPLWGVWWLVSCVTGPLINKMTQSRRFLLLLERICRQVKSDDGVSHIIAVGQRKSLSESAETTRSSMDPDRQRLRERKWE